MTGKSGDQRWGDQGREEARPPLPGHARTHGDPQADIS